MKKTFLLRSSASLLLALVACQPDADADATSSSDHRKIASSNKSLESIVLTEKPADPVSVSSLFADPQPGRQVVISGLVMGRLNPFIENRAILVLGDPEKITPCNKNLDDTCETPWDVCCDDGDVIKKSIATIQILDEKGSPLKVGLKGLAGIKELSALIVAGSIAEGSNASNMLVNATGIFVAQP